jgi:hypothetical protein
MNIPWWLFLIVILLFILRDIYYNKKFENTDFDEGYKHAVKDITDEWNRTLNSDDKTRLKLLFIYIKQLNKNISKK